MANIQHNHIELVFHKKPHIFTKISIFCVFFFCTFRQLRFIEALSLSDFFVITALFLMLFDNSFELKSSIKTKFVLIVLFILAYFSLTSILVAEDPISSATNFIKIAFAFIILPFVIKSFMKVSYQPSKLYWAYVAGTIVAGLIDIFFPQTQIGERASGFTGHPVYNGILTSIAISIVLIYEYKNSIYRIFGYMILPLLIYILLQSVSVTGILIICTTLVIWITFSFRFGNIRRVIPLVILILMSVSYVWNSAFFLPTKNRILLNFNPKTGYSLNASSGISTVDARLFSITEGWVRIQESWIFGHGLDSAGRLTSVNLEPHNIFILGWQTGGILLLFLGILFFLFSLLLFFKAYKLRAHLEASMICSTWISLLSSPLIYERSILPTFFVAIYSIQRVLKQKISVISKPVF